MTFCGVELTMFVLQNRALLLNFFPLLWGVLGLKLAESVSWEMEEHDSFSSACNSQPDSLFTISPVNEFPYKVSKSMQIIEN